MLCITMSQFMHIAMRLEKIRIKFHVKAPKINLSISLKGINPVHVSVLKRSHRDLQDLLDTCNPALVFEVNPVSEMFLKLHYML